jgi:hypothetical protein
MRIPPLTATLRPGRAHRGAHWFDYANESNAAAIGNAQ